jgi:hypothetical protein
MARRFALASPLDQFGPRLDSRCGRVNATTACRELREGVTSMQQSLDDPATIWIPNTEPDDGATAAKYIFEALDNKRVSDPLARANGGSNAQLYER